MRLIALSLSLLIIGCTHRQAVDRKPDRVDTTFTFVMDSPESGGTFPQVPDSSRVFADGSVRAPSNAPACVVPSIVDSQWVEVRTTIPTRYLSSIALKLPPGFDVPPYATDREATDESGEHWDHILGSWERLAEGRMEPRSPHFALWIGPREGYPTAFIGGEEIKQVSLQECRLQSGVGEVAAAVFTVKSPRRDRYYLAVYWGIQDGVYVRGMASAQDSLSLTQLLAAAATMRVFK
jgi:hypothetical protein